MATSARTSKSTARRCCSRCSTRNSGTHAVAFVPAWARYPYEVWVAPRVAVSRLDEVSAAQRQDLARALKTVLLKYDGLWSRPFPYLMAWYQAPVDGLAHPESHLHAE